MYFRIIREREKERVFSQLRGNKLLRNEEGKRTRRKEITSPLHGNKKKEREKEREKMGIIISRAKRRKKESVEAAKKARKKEGWVRQKGVQK